MGRDSSATQERPKSKTETTASKRHQKSGVQRRLLTPGQVKDRLPLPVVARLIKRAGVPRVGKVATLMFRDTVVYPAFKRMMTLAHAAAVSRGAKTVKSKDITRGLEFHGEKMFTAHLKKRSSRSSSGKRNASKETTAEIAEPKQKEEKKPRTGPKSAKKGKEDEE